ncbi:MAG TPA: BON domain-containing protein [Oligoflexia bacterium]|nr:BON domain-containing protein [Oligoflexia bacterium]HMP47442.1 BON domain-containing protein [Oligoflexia bacterium]
MKHVTSAKLFKILYFLPLSLLLYFCILGSCYVPGVIAQVNDENSDNILTPSDVVKKFKERLSNSSDLQNYQVSASINSSGSLTLSGKAGSIAEKEIILGLARELPGVITIHDQITIEPSLNHNVYTDKEVQDKINNSLKLNQLPLAEITVEDGVAILKGEFKSFREVDKISSTILNTEGVKDLKTEITVNGKDYQSAFIQEFKSEQRSR